MLIHNSLTILLPAALAIGFIHTLMGPDHYIPFIAMAKVKNWPLKKALFITTLCGIGHVGSALLLALLGATLGLTLTKLNLITSTIGSAATWVLIVFGILYFIWGLKRAHKEHGHVHFSSSSQSSKGDHIGSPLHVHSKEITPWILFTIFILGPCEALIPLVLYPAIRGEIINVFSITIVFGLSTLFVMLGMVAAAIFGVKKVNFNFLTKYGNAIAGLVICSTGCAIKILGL
ncbi:MAG: hypothetical protein JXR42_01335 [Gammaproteobacteria bacterium]|nr:hypothetical protein [Gammaproteobacteria bacterium]